MIDIIAPGFQTIPTLIPSMLSQTDPDWRLTILHDGWDEKWLKLASDYAQSDSRITIGATHKRANLIGHNIRRYLIEQIVDDGDYIVVSNHDNYHFPNFIESLRARDEDAVIYDICHNYDNYDRLCAQIEFGKIDCMQLATKKSIAKKVGWRSFEPASDYTYIEACWAEAKTHYHIDSMLGIHN